MSNRLMIRSESDDFVHWSWVALDNENRPYGDVLDGDLSTLAEHANGKRLVLIIPGRSLLIASVELPEGNVRTISSAIPYAMEERIADDIEYMHFAHGRRQSNGMIPVAAISKKFLTDILRVLADANLHPIWAVAEPLLLPWKVKELSILIGADSVIVRDGDVSGYECAISQLPTLLRCSEIEKGELEAIRMWKRDDADISGLFCDGESRLIVDKCLSDFDCLTEFGLKHPTINILQGFDALESRQVTPGSWKPAIVLTMAAVFLYIGTSIYQYYSLRQEIKAVTQNTEKLFHETFPDVKRIVQPLVQAQQKLHQRMASNGQEADDLLALLLALGEAKQKSKAIEFKNLEYRQNSMVIHLEGESVAQIEEFKQQLESNSNTITNILSTVSKDDKVEARIKIQAKPA